MIKEFYLHGHHYKLVQIEGSSDFMCVCDGTKTAKVSKEVAEKGLESIITVFN